MVSLCKGGGGLEPPCFLRQCHGQLDMTIMGQLMAMNTSYTVTVAAVEQEMYTALFFHQGKPVCLKTFQFLHAIGNSSGI